MVEEVQAAVPVTAIARSGSARMTRAGTTVGVRIHTTTHHSSSAPRRITDPANAV